MYLVSSTLEYSLGKEVYTKVICYSTLECTLFHKLHSGILLQNTPRISIKPDCHCFQVKREVGNVDILINNAGIVTGRRFLDCPDQLMEKTMEVNINAHFWVKQ